LPAKGAFASKPFSRANISRTNISRAIESVTCIPGQAI
jgi:hypothetical protein